MFRSVPCSVSHFTAVFGPTLAYAGHVVDRVADQGQVIDDALGRHTELALHALRHPAPRWSWY
jgi:hypothetical protein